MSTKDPTSATTLTASKPSPTTSNKPNRLPAPSLFVGPPSRNASQLSIARLDTATKSRDPLIRQRTALNRSETADGNPTPTTSTALPTLRKASEKEADARWREMRRTLDDVELTAQSSTHVFGASHAAALDDLRKAQVELARAWGRGKEGAEGDAGVEGPTYDRFGVADDIARERAGIGRKRGDTVASASTTLSDESVISESTAGGGEGGGGVGGGTLEDETAADIRLASERRAANEAYFKKVEAGVKDVVNKLEVVAESMRGVEGESRSLWSQTGSERSSGSEEGRAEGGGRKAQAAGVPRNTRLQQSDKGSRFPTGSEHYPLASARDSQHSSILYLSRKASMTGLIDFLTVWTLALRFTQPVVSRPSYHLGIDTVILALSAAQMWRTFFARGREEPAGVYEKFAIALLGLFAVEVVGTDMHTVLAGNVV
ncbi:hypothetical protein LTR53_006607 [Teratosphaeriaceae sp. CCFEE 6253]|nr:hypothetical protein LTR53_006607 [Teratosphaeriaceae sp. CCFEE 6253]